MEAFQVKQIRPGAYCMLDADEDSFYLVEGKEKAAVIDTGITQGGKILPQIRQLTDKPLVLILTHAHIDHFHHMDEFDTVYMSHRELELDEETLRFMMAGKELDLEGTVDIVTGSRIDLGGRVLEICEVPGHTPGSVVIYDAQDDLLFTGDAIGSGCGVWMQLPHSSSLEAFEKSLRSFLSWLVERGGAMEFWGGHSNQFDKSSQVPGYNPLSMGLLADLIDLVRKVRLGEIQGEVVEMASNLQARQTRYAAFGRAEMLFNPDNL